jgi:hypothetical protein
MTDIKEKPICKVCSPEAASPCRLSSTYCPYRDTDTIND